MKGLNRYPPENSPKLSTPTERRLADDLHTHQFELHMQNQELLRTRSDLEQSRARYLELFDFAPVGYLVLTPRALIENVNLAAAELLGLDRQRILNTTFTAYLDDATKALYRAHLEAVFVEPGSHSLDLDLAGVHGAAGRHVHIVSRMIRSDATDARLCLSALIDITARKDAERQIHQLNRSLQDTNHDLEAFVYSISHDLRGPLRSMAGYAEILTEESASLSRKEVKEHAGRIVAATGRLRRLVDDLLRFSRLGRKPLEITPVDLGALVDEALEELAADLKGREIEWRRAPLPVADCDRGLMRQVFVNLLSNALKYSRPRQRAIISIATEIRGPERVVIIQDNGVGFDMKYRHKLFGVFQRLHVSGEFEGNGVGLAMVARVLARHNGRIYAEGTPDKGAAFWFSFDGLRGPTAADGSARVG
jgi:PAS domain S-box-containing protein